MYKPSNTAYYLETRACLEEVESCLLNGNIRAATNMLFSTVIVDIVEKLNDLPGGQGVKILDNKKINSKGESGKFQPGYEKNIIDLTKSETKLLEDSELYGTIEYLQRLRNECSHPYVSNARVKITIPNKEIICGILHDLNERLFSKPAEIFGKFTDTFTDFLEQLNQSVKGYTFNEIKGLLKNRYYKFLDDSQKIRLCKDLCMFTFKKEGDHYDDNRSINFIALYVLVCDNEDILAPIVQEFLSHEDGNLNNDFSKFYISMIYMALKDHLNVSSNIGIRNLEENYIHRHFFTDLIYESVCDVEPHKVSEDNCVNYSENYLIDFDDFICDFCAIQFDKLISEGNFIPYDDIILYLSKADTYDKSNLIYIRYVHNIISHLPQEYLDKLLDVINKNDQIYMAFDVRKDRDRMIEIYKKFDKETNIREKCNNLFLRNPHEHSNYE